MSYPEYWKKSQRGYFSSILDIPDSYKNFEKIVSYNELERSTKIMECYKCISMKKAGRRSSMKSHFHGLRGLGVQDVRWTSVLHGPKWNGDFPQQAKKAFCTYKCTACQLAIFM